MINFFGFRDTLKYNRTLEFTAETLTNFVAVFCNSQDPIGSYIPFTYELSNVNRQRVIFDTSTNQGALSKVLTPRTINVQSNSGTATFDRILVIDAGDFADDVTFYTTKQIAGTLAGSVFTTTDVTFKSRLNSRFSIPGLPGSDVFYRSEPAGGLLEETGTITFPIGDTPPGAPTLLINAGRYTLLDCSITNPVTVTETKPAIIQLPSVTICI